MAETLQLAAPHTSQVKSPQQNTKGDQMTGSIPDRLKDPLTGCVHELGLDLEEISLTPAGKHRVLRVAVDQDGGVTIDDIARATRAISTLLDDSDLMGAQPYTLEVGSRGASSPLIAARHWRRNTGRLVRVVHTDGEVTTGRLVDSNEASAELATETGDVTVDYADVTEAFVQFELNPKGN